MLEGMYAALLHALRLRGILLRPKRTQDAWHGIYQLSVQTGGTPCRVQPGRFLNAPLAAPGFAAGFFACTFSVIDIYAVCRCGLCRCHSSGQPCRWEGPSGWLGRGGELLLAGVRVGSGLQRLWGVVEMTGHYRDE